MGNVGLRNTLLAVLVLAGMLGVFAGDAQVNSVKFASVFGDYTLGVDPADYGWSYGVENSLRQGDGPPTQDILKGPDGVLTVYWRDTTASLADEVEKMKGQLGYKGGDKRLQGDSTIESIWIDGRPALYQNFLIQIRPKLVLKHRIAAVQEEYKTYYFVIAHHAEEAAAEEFYKVFLREFSCRNTTPGP